MKHVLALLLLMASFLVIWTACAEPSATVLVYMCGSDISDNACEDIYEMGLAENGSQLNVVVLAGGAESWAYDEISGDTRNLITIRDGYFESITDWGWKSMGSEESLQEFIEFGLSEFPADRTVLILWDHGAGSEAGVCFDETAEGDDSLSLGEINNALYYADSHLDNFHIDVFGCDACMMAGYEMAAILSRYPVDYFVASEELVPGNGWDYTALLQALNRHPDMDAESLSRVIVDTYMETGGGNSSDSFMTLSAVRLGEMDSLMAEVEEIALSLQAQLEQGNVAEISRERSRMYTYGSFSDASWDMVDLGTVLDAYARFDPEHAAQARKQLGRAVAVSRRTDNLDPCSGLSICIPQDTRNEFEEYADGMALSLYLPNWEGFVRTYAKQLQEGSFSFSLSGAQLMTETGGLTGQTANQCGQEIYCWDDESGSYDIESVSGTSVTVSEGEYAFTAHLSGEDLRYLDYVEGMLLLDISDEEMTAYVDFGLMRRNLINWDTGDVYSLFDGTWPVFGGQMVPLYDQISNAWGRRSLIPVRLNGEYTYLVVEFVSDSSEGRIIGANAGYDENGLPIRSTEKLKEGDRIVPVYSLYVDTGEQELQEEEFDGDEIIWTEGMTVMYEDLSEEGETLEAMFCFVLNDVFGGYELSDLIAFEL